MAQDKTCIFLYQFRFFTISVYSYNNLYLFPKIILDMGKNLLYTHIIEDPRKGKLTEMSGRKAQWASVKRRRGCRMEKRPLLRQ